MREVALWPPIKAKAGKDTGKSSWCEAWGVQVGAEGNQHIPEDANKDGYP